MEKLFKKEYGIAKLYLEELIDKSFDDNYELPYGSDKLASVLKTAIEFMEESKDCYKTYELKLQQLMCLIREMYNWCVNREVSAEFRGELFNISHRAINKTNKTDEWRDYSLRIKDMYLH